MTTPTRPTTVFLSAARAVRAYTRSFQNHFGASTSATSALGGWLLLALIGPAAAASNRTELEKALGCDADHASEFARALLADPHPAVANAVASWSRPELLNPSYATWAQQLPPSVGQQTMPTPAEADAWVAARTKGMIQKLPLPIYDDTALILTSALAADVEWIAPYKKASPTRLGGAFGVPGRAALTGRGSNAIIHTAAAGLVGVHQMSSTQHLTVLSVIADPDQPPAAVHAAALEILEGLAARTPLTPTNLWDLPLTGHAWTLKEGPGQEDHLDGVLPVWRAERPPFSIGGAPGFPAALSTAMGFLNHPDQPAAHQSVFAEYTAKGFRAASATSLGVALGSPPTPSAGEIVRRGDLRFNRPYAVLAFTDSPGNIWHGMPIFSAWVTEDLLQQTETATQ
jgi:hypothetical protein